jgi:hypothetical protein
MQHPGKEEEDIIKVKLDWCFLLDGKTPNGLASFSYENPISKSLLFKGAGVFNEGVLDGGPAVIIDGDNIVLSCSQMSKGRLSGWGTGHFPESKMIHLNSKETETDVSGLLTFAG